jgi:RNA-directed DNA polymerase
MRLHQKKMSIQELAALLNTKVSGCMNYYFEFDEYTTRDLWWLLNLRLIRWVRTNRKFNLYRAVRWLKNIYKTQPKLFAHWSITRL